MGASDRTPERDDTSSERTLARSDWAELALEHIADRGLAAIRIDDLAAELGVTKGSFYWHFGGRDELVALALSTWCEAACDAFGAEGEPGERLVFIRDASLREALMARVEIALAGSIEDERVTPFVERAFRARMVALEAAFAALGAAVPHRAALRANMLYLGFLASVRSDPMLAAPAAAAMRASWDSLSS